MVFHRIRSFHANRDKVEKKEVDKFATIWHRLKLDPTGDLEEFEAGDKGRGVRAKRNIPVGIFLCCYFGKERTGNEMKEHGYDNGYTVTVLIKGRTITYVDFPSFLQSSLYRLSKTQLSREIRYK